MFIYTRKELKFAVMLRFDSATEFMNLCSMSKRRFWLWWFCDLDLTCFEYVVMVRVLYPREVPDSFFTEVLCTRSFEFFNISHVDSMIKIVGLLDMFEKEHRRLVKEHIWRP